MKRDGNISTRIHFIVPGNINTLTGGYIYDKRIIRSLEEIGCKVELHQLAGDFPFPDDNRIEECRHLLAGIADKETVVIDGLVSGIIPGAIIENAGRLNIIPLVHMPLAMTPGIGRRAKEAFFRSEAESLRHSRFVIVTSSFTKNALLHYGIESKKVYEIKPGQEKVSRKSSYPPSPRNLLCVANILPGKGHVTLVEALAELKAFRWQLTCCGGLHHDSAYTEAVKDKIRDSGLKGRIIFKGALSGESLEKEYLNADLFVFPSEFETCGMALIEAISYGLPVVTTSGGAIKTTVQTTAAEYFQPGDKRDLQKILGALFSDEKKYRKLCYDAKHKPSPTHTWDHSARMFLRLLRQHSAHIERNSL